MNYLDEHAENRGVIESILRKIPGFSGYLKREARRDSDALARQWIAGQLKRAKSHLDAFSRNLVEVAKIDSLPKIEQVRSHVDRVIGKVQGAPAGYSGFFDLVQVDEELLLDVYQLDKQLMDDAEQFSEWVSSQNESETDPIAFTGDALARISAIEEEFEKRNQLLLGFDPE